MQNLTLNKKSSVPLRLFPIKNVRKIAHIYSDHLVQMDIIVALLYSLYFESDPGFSFKSVTINVPFIDCQSFVLQHGVFMICT